MTTGLAQKWLRDKELRVDHHEPLEAMLLRRLQEAIRDDNLIVK